MRKLAVCTIAMALSAGVPGGAFAADPIWSGPDFEIAHSDPQQPTWHGLHVGASGGYGWGRKDWFFGGPFSTGHDVTGFLAGAQVGMDLQAGAVVIGVEGEWDWADLNGSSICPNPLVTCRTHVGSIASVSGRLGWAHDRALYYVRGGGAWVDDAYSLRGIFVSEAGAETRFGWLVGVGVEYALPARWSARLEYDHYALGTRDVTLTDTGGAYTYVAAVTQSLHVVKLGLNYRFGGDR